MRFSRLLIPAQFIIFCAASSIAQSPASSQNRSSAPLKDQIPTPTYRLHSSSELQFLQGGGPPEADQHSFKFRAPRLLDGSPTLRSGTALTSTLGDPVNLNQRCYTLRQYQFEQVDPKSDVTRLKDYTACQPAGKIRLRGATVAPSH